ncbi:VOC family protein [Exilibacterium tricleocarpae]|uniref:VOC family protein n=1 Tax=Exilibacterium tricleocarpae TaxID=2591008 RepID=A0A545T678_9GAMM|nr:VOC family protein [Exilibacterium tricleocarpae]TQV72685.1 VOC family protein [Exilibacterium tricleocarpae]
MSDDIPTIMSHVSVGTNQFEKAIEFYDKVLATLGAKRVLEELKFKAVAYGKQFPEFWVQAPYDGGAATVGNGTHFAFLAMSKDQVHAFYDAATAAGATDDGAPGPRPHYGEAYYGCFVRDPDGNKIEAMYWDMALA